MILKILFATCAAFSLSAMNEQQARQYDCNKRLVDAIKANSIEKVRAALSEGANPTEFGMMFNSFFPIHLVLREREPNLEIVKLLLNYRANINLTCFNFSPLINEKEIDNSCTVVEWAACKGDAALTKVLLDYGNSLTKFKVRALALAKRRNNIDVAKLIYGHLDKTRQNFAKLLLRWKNDTALPHVLKIHISKFLYGDLS